MERPSSHAATNHHCSSSSRLWLKTFGVEYNYGNCAASAVSQYKAALWQTDKNTHTQTKWKNQACFFSSTVWIMCLIIGHKTNTQTHTERIHFRIQYKEKIHQNCTVLRLNICKSRHTLRHKLMWRTKMCVSTQTHTCPTSAHCSYRANHWPRTVVYVTAHTRSYVGHGLRVGVCLSIGVEGTLGGRADTHIHRCTRMQLCGLCVCVFRGHLKA